LTSLVGYNSPQQWSAILGAPLPVGQHLSLPWIVVIGASLLAALVDLRCRRIPNWLTGPLFVAGLVWSGYWGGLGGLGESAGTAGLLALPYIVLFLVAGGGAGDAKLMGAVGAWLGFRPGCQVLVAVCLSGMVMGLAWAACKRRSRGVFNNILLIGLGLVWSVLARRKFSEDQSVLPNTKNMLTMPYGLAIFLGVCIVALREYLLKVQP